MNKNPLYDELTKYIESDLSEAKTNKLWNDRIAEEYHKLTPSEVFRSDYFLNLKDTLYPFFFDLADQLHAERAKRKIDLVVLNMGIGSGKALLNGTGVLTNSGYQPIETLSVGDYVFGSSGELVKVLGVFPQGKKKIVKLTFSDGSVINCSEDHLWETQTFKHRNNNHYKDYKKNLVRTTKEIIDTIKDGKMSNHSIRSVKPINFSEKEELILTPYTFGALLGDGGFFSYKNLKRVSFSSGDSFIIDKIVETLPNSVVLQKVKNRKYDYYFKSIEHKKKRNLIVAEIDVLNLLGKKSHEKFIPKKYLYSSINNRIALLHGLMDTDGYCSKKGKLVYYTTSLKLKENVKFLIESLGGVVHTSEKKPKYKYKGVVKEGKLCYCLHLNLPDWLSPFSLPRKTELYQTRTKYKNIRYITDFEYLEEEMDCTCISVDSEDNLFVTENCILTHNTYCCSAFEYYEWLRFTTTPNKKEAFPGIDPETMTAFILMSRDKDKAKKIVFTNIFRHFQCPFNMEYFPPNPRVKTYLDIPRNKTLIFPGTGEAVSALGFNLYSGVVDEAAFLQNVVKDSSSEGDEGDSAKIMFDQIHGRIESRFGKNGGPVYMITSANKEGNWIEKVIIDSIKFGNEKHKVFWRRAPIWKTKPPNFYPSGETFLFNKETYEIITDIDMIREYFDARDRLNLSTEFNPILGGLLL